VRAKNEITRLTKAIQCKQGDRITSGEESESKVYDAGNPKTVQRGGETLG